MTKLSKQQLRSIIASETRKVVKEEYARGIPDFAISEVASEAAEGLKRHLRAYVNRMSQNPTHQRQMLASANEVVKELEQEIKAKLEDKLLKFLRQT